MVVVVPLEWVVASSAVTNVTANMQQTSVLTIGKKEEAILMNVRVRAKDLGTVRVVIFLLETGVLFASQVMAVVCFIRWHMVCVESLLVLSEEQLQDSLARTEI